MSVSNFARSLVAAAASMAIAGCASQSDLEQIQRNELQLRSMIAEDRQQIQQLQDRTGQMENLVKETAQGRAPGRGGGRQANRRLNNIEQRLNRLEAQMGQAPEQSEAPGVPAGAGEGGAAAPGAPSATGPGDTGATARAAPAPAIAVAAAAPDLGLLTDQELSRARSTPGAEGRTYSAGLEAMKQGRYATAVSQFALFKKRFPKSALNEPAQYFSAAALYREGKFDESILQFNDLAMRYPKGRFATAALLYEARAFLKLNDKIDARLTLQKLIADHGDSPQASAARELMRSLESD